jgi:hypothetical protein
MQSHGPHFALPKSQMPGRALVLKGVISVRSASQLWHFKLGGNFARSRD